VALIVVIAVTATVITTVLLTRAGSPSNPTTASSPADGIATENAESPVQLIIKEPTCDAWAPIPVNVSAAQNGGWVQRDPAVPVGDWSPELQNQYQTVARALRTAADATVPLAQQTPHRVIRELYDQYIAYARAYSDALSTYSADDNELILAVNSAAQAITSICTAITNRSAETRSVLVKPVPAPNPLPPTTSPRTPPRMLIERNPICPDWLDSSAQFERDIAPMLAIDFELAAAQWSQEQRATMGAAGLTLTAFADEKARLGLSSANPVVEDLANMSAVYMRAYAGALPTYIAADTELYNVAVNVSGVVSHGCRAIENG
jgi:hypothetical protein